MKLLVTLVLACTLFSKAYPLDCFECIPEGLDPCVQSTKTCPASDTKCISATAEVAAGGTQTEIKLKTCVPPAQCVSGSLNFGISSTTISSTCCDSNLCNNRDAPALPASSANGMQCFTCDVNNNCAVILECKGMEDRCLSSTVSAGGQTVTMKGCASQSICTGDASAQLGSIAVDLSCCEGNLCNNALRVGQSVFFLLLVPLASFVLLI